MTNVKGSPAASAEQFAQWIVALKVDDIPDAVTQTMQRLLLDAGGLCIAARKTSYVRATVASRDGEGACTALGHSHRMTRADAALVMGTSIHGEDFDDTFEGTPVHVGAVVVPAVLAAAQGEPCSGARVLKAMAVGGELMCRMAVVAPTAIHRAGFHPTAVVGAFGAAAAMSVVLGLSAAKTTAALGIAGSMASGIIEYLAEGTSTKRMHPGWAAAAGIKAARLAAQGFSGPRTVLDGTHGFYHAFADASIAQDLDHITRDLGNEWHVGRLAFKPYACGTMIQPFIDCALQLRERVDAGVAIESIKAFVGEGTVHRLWEPVAEKARPSTPYSAKFSGPYGIAIALHDGAGGLAQFSRERLDIEEVGRLADAVTYVIDPDNEYPRNYTARLQVTLRDGQQLDAHQPCLRGGVSAPLSDDELLAKYTANTEHGGWSEKTRTTFANYTTTLFAMPTVTGLEQFRGD